jgi:ribosomal protein S18 acetylase RimI-like enzyme
MGDIKIRKAISDDLEQLYIFEQDLIRTERPFDPTIKEKIHYYDLEEMMTASHIHLVVAELNNKIIGTGYARLETSKHYLKHSTHAYLGFMYLLPEHRGKGINKEILDALKTWIRSQNITELRLEVYHDNIPAIKAYEKFGFEKHILEMRLDLEEK